MSTPPAPPTPPNPGPDGLARPTRSGRRVRPPSRFGRLRARVVAAATEARYALRDAIRRARPVARPEVRFVRLLVGLPAVLTAAGLVGVIVRQKQQPPPAAVYRAAGERLFRAKDYEGAVVCLKRLVALEPFAAGNRFALAMAFDAVGEHDRAESLARSVAPADRLGLPAAHGWLAMRSLKLLGQGAWRAADAEAHLVLYLRANPRSPQALDLLGKLRAHKTGAPRALASATAVPPRASAPPPTSPLIQDVIKVKGDPAEARRRADKIIAEARRDVAARPDDPKPRLLWANAHLAVDDFAAAADVLEEASKASPNPVFRRATATVAAAWFDSLERSGRSRPDERLAVLERGLRAEPSAEGLYLRLSKLLRDGGPTADRVRQRFRADLDGGGPPGLIHYLLGNDAWANGRKEEARQHFEAGYRAEPRSPILANNLAWSLIHLSPEDPARALTLIDAALSAPGADPRMRGTRGEILSRLGRWAEAVKDLEFAVAAGDASPELRATLAATYERLGRPDDAARHRPKPAAAVK